MHTAAQLYWRTTLVVLPCQGTQTLGNAGTVHCYIFTLYTGANYSHASSCQLTQRRYREPTTEPTQHMDLPFQTPPYTKITPMLYLRTTDHSHCMVRLAYTRTLNTTSRMYCIVSCSISETGALSVCTVCVHDVRSIQQKLHRRPSNTIIVVDRH